MVWFDRLGWEIFLYRSDEPKQTAQLLIGHGE